MSTGRDKILKAAFELFTERGFDAVSIRDIGARAGLTNPALYQHFASKHALGEALYIACYAVLIEAIEARLTPEQTPLERLESYIHAAVALHAHAPSPLLFLEDHQRLFAPAARARFGARSVTDRLDQWVRDGQKTGLIRGDIAPAFLVGLCIGQLTKWAVMADLGLSPREGAAESLFILLRSALTPGPATPLETEG